MHWNIHHQPGYLNKRSHDSILLPVMDNLCVFLKKHKVWSVIYALCYVKQQYENPLFCNFKVNYEYIWNIFTMINILLQS